MDGLFQLEQFANFGPCHHHDDPAPPTIARVQARGPAGLRAQLRTLCPCKAGVYGMLDAAGELIYLGKAKALRTRLLSYFRTQSRPPKAGRILRHAKAIVWENCTHEFAALLREQELIRRWRPRFNVQGQPLRRRLAFVCIGRPPAPYAYLTRRPSPDANAAFGPINWSDRTVRAIQRVNDWYRLRDCPSPQEIGFPEQGGLFALERPAGCLRAELGACLAPCTGVCRQDDYSAEVQRAVRFLAGATDEPVTRLAQQMQQAAAAQEFERAARLRDHWTDLTWLAEQLGRMRQAQQAMSFVYPVIGSDRLSRWYLIHGGRVIASVLAPTDVRMAEKAGTLLDSIYRGRQSEELLGRYEHHDGRMLVMQWFRQHPRERNKTLTPDEARAICETCIRS